MPVSDKGFACKRTSAVLVKILAAYGRTLVTNW